MKIKGEATYIDENGKIHKIEGKITLPEETTFQKLKIDGKVTFENLSCDKLDVDGKCDGGIISAKNISIDGKIKADTVKVEQLFEVDGKAKISEVESDEFILDSRSSSIGEIKCKKLKIFSRGNDKVAQIFIGKIFDSEFEYSQDDSCVMIGKISAVKVDLANCEVGEIRCNNAVIRSNCTIDKLIVSGEYEIAENSKVIEIVKEDVK